MKDIKLVNCTNYFNEIGCQRLCDALESGVAIRIHIDCIGHSATIRESSIYVDWLKETYGERLVCDINEHGLIYYYLK